MYKYDSGIIQENVRFLYMKYIISKIKRLLIGFKYWLVSQSSRHLNIAEIINHVWLKVVNMKHTLRITITMTRNSIRIQLYIEPLMIKLSLIHILKLLDPRALSELPTLIRSLTHSSILKVTSTDFD